MSAANQRLHTKLRDRGVCEVCGTHLDLTVHHIIRKSHAPSLDGFIDNLKVLCERHHQEVEAQIKLKLKIKHLMMHAPDVYVGKIFDPSERGMREASEAVSAG